MKLAIFQNGDTPQIESTALMLREAGYETRVCGNQLRKALQTAGCDTILPVSTMLALGYDNLDSIKEASLDDMDRCDLFVEIKVRNVEKIVTRWPRLKDRIVYWRVNGAQPEICPKGGDEVNLPCPIITACLWYGLERYRDGRDTEEGKRPTNHEKGQLSVSLDEQKEWAKGIKYHDTESNSYVFWPPYPQKRNNEYDSIDRSTLGGFGNPYCMCHSVYAWGYGPVVDGCVFLGVHCYGNRSPAGQVHHSRVAGIAHNALALVHLKSVDCPGWALYEAILAGCPVITGRLLNSRMLAYDLLEDGETCYEFGVPASLEYGRGDMEYAKCLKDIAEALEKIKDAAENKRIGENGRERLRELLWTPADNGASFKQFMSNHFN